MSEETEEERKKREFKEKLQSLRFGGVGMAIPHGKP